MLHIGKAYFWVNNYKEQEREEGRRRTFPLVSIGFWLHEAPRFSPLCRLFGHEPVVDGYDSQHGKSARWVACGRCGLRPQPQGVLDNDLVLGQPYTGEHTRATPTMISVGGKPATLLPGYFPSSSRGNFGGQLVMLRRLRNIRIGAGIKIGHDGSEQDLAAHIHLDPLGSLYLHTERFGFGLRRRLNKDTWTSRVIEADVAFEPGGHTHHLTWSLWAKRDEHSRDDPWWMHGYKTLDPLEWIWGPKLYSYEEVGDSLASVLKLAEDDYPVNLKLQRVSQGRKKLRPKFHHFSVDVEVVGEGIPTKRTGRGIVCGFGVRVDAEAVRTRTWEAAALAEAARRIAKDRASYGFKPERDVSVAIDVAAEGVGDEDSGW